jgi:hypothetical protein
LDGEEEGTDCKRMSSARKLSSSTAMDIEETEGVSIQVPDLLDLLSDRPTLLPPIHVEARPKVAKVTSSQEPKVFTIAEIQF